MNLFGKIEIGSEVLCVCVCFSVTVVESGTRALQYLGLEGENGSLGFDVSEFCFWVREKADALLSRLVLGN